MSAVKETDWKEIVRAAQTECEELRAKTIEQAVKIARLQAERDDWEQTATVYGMVCRAKDDTIKRLRVEIERLMAAWRWAGPHLEAYAAHYPDPDYIAALEHHRRALEGK